MRRLVHLLWIVPALPGLYQVALLVFTIANRYAFPLDLEWMEGGMLAHALRFQEGHGIYAPPSVEFVPYLYTPLYPALLAGLGKVFGLGYQLGRAVSIAATAGVAIFAAVAVIREAGRGARALSAAAAACALGFFAATYPWVDGWYDLVRGDSLFLFLGVAGLVALRAWAPRPGSRLAGLWHPRVAIAAALLALSFHAKQTGVLLVAAGGATLLVMNRRAIATYVVVAGAIGGGGALISNVLTDGWYWIYVFRVHQHHDTNLDRFGKSFVHIFTQFPALTILVAAALCAVTVFAIARRRLPRGGAGFLYWCWMFACGTVIGALGWATQWAHFNAYIPAMTFGAIAAGSAVVALVGCAEEIELGEPARAALRVGVALACFVILGANLWEARWKPAPLIPTAKDRTAGEALVDRLRRIDGDVYVPAHPWYAVLAGKRPFVHRMGILDLTYRPPKSADKAPLPPRAQVIDGLEQALRTRRFGAVVMDDRCLPHEFPGLSRGYEPKEKIKPSPRVVSGAPTHPAQIWLPKPGAP